MEDPKRGESKRPPLGNTRVYNKEVESILANHIIRKKSSPPCQEYLRKEQLESEVSWEPVDDLWQFSGQNQRLHDESTRTFSN